jgi:hypothetical protein
MVTSNLLVSGQLPYLPVKAFLLLLFSNNTEKLPLADFKCCLSIGGIRPLYASVSL